MVRCTGNTADRYRWSGKETFPDGNWVIKFWSAAHSEAAPSSASLKIAKVNTCKISLAIIIS